MMRYSVTSNIREFERGVRDIDKRQIPFATALALTRTAQGGQGQVKRLLPRLLDRPTRFTERGVAIQRATKRNLVAAVFFKDIQAEYMHWQVDGGTRYPARRAIPVPVGVRLNKYGNMPRRKIAQLLARSDTFTGTVKGIAGIWQRGKRGKRRRGGTGTKGNTQNRVGNVRVGSVKLLVAFEPQARYRKRFPFYRIVERHVQRSFDHEFEKAFREAVDGAR